MKKFEYKIVSLQKRGMHHTISTEETEAALTGEGLIGWEVIGFFDNVEKGKSVTSFLMKREIGSKEDG